MKSATAYLELARKHLAKVQAAWDEPTDWPDLTIYGLYAIEAGVLAAAMHTRQAVKKTHWDKRDLALRLHESHGIPDMSELMDDLNEARKASAYGDVEFPGGLDAENVARTSRTTLSPWPG